MSRKTKQQKIIADLRRQVASQQPTYTYNKPSEKISAPVQTSNQAVATRIDYSYVKKDLLKTAVLTVLAICVQVVLWYIIGKK